MSIVCANWTNMNRCSEELLRYKNLLAQYQSTVNNVTRSLSIAMRLHTNIDENLKQLSRRMETLKTNVQSYSTALSDIAFTYQKTERGLLGEDVQRAEQEQTSIPWWKLVSKGGIIGGLVSATGDLVAGGKEPYISIPTFSKDILGTVGSVVKAAEKSDTVWWKELTGWTSVLEGVDTSNGAFSGILTKEFGKYTDFSTAGKSISAVAKWAGVGIMAIASGVDNYNEYKSGEIDAGRAVRETVMETGVDVLASAGIYAAIGAGLAATGIGAPVVLVGALAVGVKWGLDALCKSLTGKDMVELASDAILDGLEAAGEVIESAMSTATSAIRCAGNALRAGWRRICNSW